jgi:hypothetical protein
MKGAAFLILAIVLIPCGCDSEQISKLEKQNHELQAQLQKQQAADLDLQAKCARDSRTFFAEGWGRNKDTILLNYSNHYNKKQNKCFIIVEHHYNSHFAGPGGDSWTNDIEVYDVYENVKYGYFAENHYTHYKPQISTNDEMLSCEMWGKKCNGIQEFNSLAAPYMND